MGGPWTFLMFDAIGTVIFTWPLWLCLIVAQVLNFAIGLEEHRWLPMGLLGVGLAWCFFIPIITQIRMGS